MLLKSALRSIFQDPRESTCSFKNDNPFAVTFCVTALLFLLMRTVTFKSISLDRHSCSANSSSFHTMFYTPDISHKDSGIETLLERIACTVSSSYWSEELGNNCDIYRSLVPHEVASRRVVSRCSMLRSGLCNT